MEYRQTDSVSMIKNGREYVSRQFLENERDNFRKNSNRSIVCECILGGAALTLACFGQWTGALVTCGAGGLVHRLYQLNKRNFSIMNEYLELNPGDQVPLPNSPWH